MGQKVHPGGLRVGVIHDWKSNWYTGKKEFPDYLLEDVHDPRAHLQQARARRPVRHPHPQGQAADHGRHLHGAAGDRDRQVGRRGRRAAQRAARDHPEERPHQHQRDQAPRARREARRAVDRRAAPEPRQLPARDEALARLRDPLRRAGHQDHLRRPAGRRRDEPLARRTPRAACRCTRSAPTSTTASPRRRRPSAASASRSGSTRARSCPRATSRSRGRETRLGDQDQARRRGGASEGLGASREGGRGREPGPRGPRPGAARGAPAAARAAVAGRGPGRGGRPRDAASRTTSSARAPTRRPVGRGPRAAARAAARRDDAGAGRRRARHDDGKQQHEDPTKRDQSGDPTGGKGES